MSGSRPWIKVRDVALTVVAWMVLMWIMRALVFLMYDFLRHPIFELTTALPPDLAHIWSRLWILVLLSALLAVGLALWAVKDRHRLRSAKQLPAPPVLTIAEQAACFHVDAEAVAAARNFKVTDVQFRENGAIAALEGRPGTSRHQASLGMR